MNPVQNPVVLIRQDLLVPSPLEENLFLHAARKLKVYPDVVHSHPEHLLQERHVDVNPRLILVYVPLTTSVIRVFVTQ